MSLNREIELLLAGYNVPAEIVGKLAAAIAEVEENQVAPGLPVGATAPDFQLLDSAGRVVSLKGRLSQGLAVLSFFRGSWCPICNLQIRALQRALPDIRNAHGSVIAVHPDDSMTEDDESLEFDVLPDPAQDVIRLYRLQYTVPEEVRQIYTGLFNTDVSRHNQDGSWNIPVPGTFVIDQLGIIRRRHVSADYTRRMEPDDIVAALRAIESPGAD